MEQIETQTEIKPVVDIHKGCYQTRIKPSHEETYNYLRGFKKPRYAYLLMEAPTYHVLSRTDSRWGTGLCTLNVENRPSQIEKIRHYVLRKRFKILDWGNFYASNDPKPARAAKARAHTGPDGVNPWVELENEIIQLTQINPNWQSEKLALENELDGFKQKLIEAENKLNEVAERRKLERK